MASLLALYTEFDKKSDTILASLKMTNYEAWNFLTFRNVVANYNIYINKVYHINSAIEFINYIKEKYPPSIRDYAIFYYLNSYKPVTKNKLDTLNKLVTEFAKYAIYKDFATNLNTNLEKYNSNFKAKDSKTISLLSMNSDKLISLDQLIAQNTGKLIFIDFWASWCAPCLAEMPNSSALAKGYKIKKASIVFLYLSKDENMSAWKNKSKDLELLENKSFVVLNNDAFLQFSNKYNIRAIPRYMIIGKKGEMIDPDALQPSDPKLKVFLDKLLN